MVKLINQLTKNMSRKGTRKKRQKDVKEDNGDVGFVVYAGKFPVTQSGELLYPPPDLCTSNRSE